MIKKGIILAGGKGTRMSPLTKAVNKQLLPIYDKPLIFYPLSILMLANIKDILIIVNKGQLKQYKQILPNGNNLGIKITYLEQDKPRGLPDAFVIGEKFIGKENVAMILGDNFFYGQNLTEKLMKLRLHGLSKDAWKRYLPDLVSIKNHSVLYDVKYTGFKYNMIDLQAAMGVCQLDKVNSMWKIRKKLYSNYLKAFKNLPVFFQAKPDYKFKHGYHLFLMVLDKIKTKKNRDDLIEFLRKKRIGASVHYRSVTEMSNYKKLLKWKNSLVPNSFYVGKNTISLPLYPGLTLKNQKYIISEVKNFFDV